MPAMMFWYLDFMNDAEVGDMGGFSFAAGSGGTLGQTRSPRFAMGTGWLQFEHLTVGRTCEIRGSEPATAERAITSVCGW